MLFICFPSFSLFIFHVFCKGTRDGHPPGPGERSLQQEEQEEPQQDTESEDAPLHRRILPRGQFRTHDTHDAHTEGDFPVVPAFSPNLRSVVSPLPA